MLAATELDCWGDVEDNAVVGQVLQVAHCRLALQVVHVVLVTLPLAKQLQVEAVWQVEELRGLIVLPK